MIDYRALTEPSAIPDPVVRRYVRSPRTVPWINPVIALIPASFAALFTAAGLATFFDPARLQGPLLMVLFFIAFGAISAGIPLIIVVAIVWQIRNTEYAPSLVNRLPKFAADNGMIFSPRDADPNYSGGLFSMGSQRAAVNHIRSATGAYVDFGDFEYVIQGSETRRTVMWGFIAIHLGRPLPHIVLEAALPGFPGWKLPVAFDRRQVLSLEGDFDQSFTLYAPREYEQDALYIFAPDLMSLLIDQTGGFHVEIIDEWLFVYAPRSFKGFSAEDYARLMAIIELVGAKARRQTGRYVDARAMEGAGRHQALTVHRRGRRLRRTGKRSTYLLLGTLVGVAVGVLVSLIPA